jgi:putative transposase
MHFINGVYTQTYNRRHAQVGHLFQGRFEAVLVDKDAYFLEVCRYVDLNPVRASIIARPEEWAWSSYGAHTERAPAPSWLDSLALHRQLSSRPDQGPQLYAEFAAAGRNVRLWESALNGQIYLGDARFVRKMQAHAASLLDRDVPRTQRRPRPHPLSWYLARDDRNTAIVTAHLEGGYTQSAIAQATGLSVSRVSRLVSLHEAKGKT